MPHVNSSGGDDLASTDEVKVYKDEGEEENRSSENLSEDKLGLVTETEEDKDSDLHGRSYRGGEKGSGSGSDGKPPDQPGPDRPPLGGSYLVSPYPYPNGATVPGGLKSLSPSLLNGHLGKSVVQPHHHGLASLMMYNNEHFTSPPPAHMGIPPVHIDPKTVHKNGHFLQWPSLHLDHKGLPRTPMYAIPPPPGQFPHPLYSPEFSNVQWNSAGYPITTAGFRGPYPTTLSSSALPRFSPPGLLPPHPGMPHGIPHPAIITPGPKQDIPHHNENHSDDPRDPTSERMFYSHHFGIDADRPLFRQPIPHHDQTNGSPSVQSEPKKPRIKKPLNAFMLYMKEMRAQIAAECTLKESAAINQILGRRWHALDRSEQAKYYDMARKEKELHMQLYPGWSARDNYATHNKKKKRKRDTPPTPGDTKGIGMSDIYCENNQNVFGVGVLSECTNPKKCRARFGLDQQNQWCKPCRRKKKCIRFLGGDEDDDDTDDEGSNSVATIDSTTDGDGQSGRGSPTPSSTVDDGVQSSAVSQSQPHDVASRSLPAQPSLPTRPGTLPDSSMPPIKPREIPSNSLAVANLLPSSTVLAT